MNKYLLLIGFLAMFCSTPAFAQKKAANAGKPAALEFRNEADTLSYAFGASIVEGLPQYLIQTGVLADTSAIAADFNMRIQSEPDAARQNALKKEMRLKIDSANAANATAIEDVLQGFSQVFLSPDSKNAFNTGMAIATQMRSTTDNFAAQALGGQEFNRQLFASAFTASLKQEDLLIPNSQELIQQKAMVAQQASQRAEEERIREQYADQIRTGNEFMEQNKTQPGVVVLPNELQYRIIDEGTGATPKMNDRVVVHYKGMLLDGTVFDSSFDRGEPAEFRVGQLIEGWNQALTMMPVGSKWILYIPYDLAYGSRDMGQIKPFSNLIFELELISMESAE